MSRPTLEERIAICQAQQHVRDLRQVLYANGRPDPSRWDYLFPCPSCGEQGVKADVNHSLCRRCEGYSA